MEEKTEAVYKRKLQELRDKIEVAEANNKSLQALLGAILTAFNVGEDNPITMSREAVSEAIKHRHVMTWLNEDMTEYKLWVVQND